MANRKHMTGETIWYSLPNDLYLTENEIHIWKIPLNLDESALKKYQQVLSQNEQAQATRFHFEKDQHRFIISRGELKKIISRYIGLSPAQIEFRYGEYGKPFLREGIGDGSIQFNLTHSNQLAICVVVRNYQVGVDIEKIHPLPDADQIAERFFSAAEYSVYQQLPDEQKAHAFFNCWTRKEAFIKAIGEGLSYPLHKFEVTLIPGDPPKILEVYDDPQEAAKWAIRSFIPAPGYLGAVAVKKHGLQVRFFETEM